MFFRVAFTAPDARFLKKSFGFSFSFFFSVFGKVLDGYKIIGYRI